MYWLILELGNIEISGVGKKENIRHHSSLCYHMFIFPRTESCYSDREKEPVTSHCGHQDTIINRWCWRPLNTHQHTHTHRQGVPFRLLYDMPCKYWICAPLYPAWDLPRRCCHGWQFVVFIRTAGCVGPNQAAAATWQLSLALLHNVGCRSDLSAGKVLFCFFHDHAVLLSQCKPPAAMLGAGASHSLWVVCIWKEGWPSTQVVLFVCTESKKNGSVVGSAVSLTLRMFTSHLKSHIFK